MGLYLEISYPSTIKDTTKNLKFEVKRTGERNSKGALDTRPANEKNLKQGSKKAFVLSLKKACMKQIQV